MMHYGMGKDTRFPRHPPLPSEESCLCFFFLSILLCWLNELKRTKKELGLGGSACQRRGKGLQDCGIV